MTWLNCIDNPKSILSIYSVPPELDGVQISGLRLHQDGPRLDMAIQLPIFPDKPPAKWHQDCNTVIVGLDFWGVEDIRIIGWETTNIVTVQMTQLGPNKYLLNATNEKTKISAIYLHARVDGISGYETR
jgi:hypothetical protein